GWTGTSVQGDSGSGWVLQQDTTGTIAGPGSLDFQFSATPPAKSNTTLAFFSARLLASSSSNTREISSTLEPAIIVLNNTPLLDVDDDRYDETRAMGGSQQL